MVSSTPVTSSAVAPVASAIPSADAIPLSRSAIAMSNMGAIPSSVRKARRVSRIDGRGQAFRPRGASDTVRPQPDTTDTGRESNVRVRWEPRRAGARAGRLMNKWGACVPPSRAFTGKESRADDVRPDPRDLA